MRSDRLSSSRKKARTFVFKSGGLAGPEGDRADDGTAASADEAWGPRARSTGGTAPASSSAGSVVTAIGVPPAARTTAAATRALRAASLAWTHPLVARLAPALVERRALDAFATPTRAPHPVAPGLPGIAAHRFTVDLLGERLAAWDWGTSGPTVLLVHGWNSAASQLTRFVPPLLRAGFTVAAFDHVGHGLSTGRRATLRTMRDAVRAVAAKLGPVHAIIGHSLGASAAALAVADGLRVERVALLAPPAEPEYFARAFAAQLGLDPARSDGMLARLRRVAGGDLGALDLRRQLVAAPALVLHDPADREVPFDHARAIARAWPQATLVPVDGVGHRRILAAESVLARVVRFVA